MITYNDANLVSYFQGLSSSGYRSFATNIRSNGVVSAMQSVFTMTANDLIPYTNMASYDSELFAQICERNANAIDAGLSVDCTGMSVMNTGGKIIIHIDYIVIFPAIGVSFWIQRIP